METQGQIRAGRAARKAEKESDEGRLEGSVTARGTSDPHHTSESYHTVP